MRCCVMNFQLCIWEEESKSNDLCQLEVVRKFQDLLVEANPCSVGNQGEQQCSQVSRGACQWCGEDFRCIPEEAACHSTSQDSLTLKKRNAITIWHRYGRVHRAWVSLLVDEDRDRVLKLAAQIVSVQTHSSYDHLTMVLPSVSMKTREFIESLGSKVKEVQPILPRSEINNWIERQDFAKLHIWNLIEYSQVAYLDPESFLVEPTERDVFDECDFDFCAADSPKVSYRSGHSGLVHTGVMVVTTSTWRFEYLVDKLSQGLDKPWLLLDGLVTDAMLDKNYPLGSWKTLDWPYNTCSQSFFDRLQNCGVSASRALYGRVSDKDITCWNSLDREASIQHACGRDLFLGTTALSHISDFQTYANEVDDCAALSGNENDCTKSSCNWCAPSQLCFSAQHKLKFPCKETEHSTFLIQNGWYRDNDYTASIRS